MDRTQGKLMQIAVERHPDMHTWWQYALWGLMGAAANRGVVFLEAVQRIKGCPWRPPHGAGMGLYATTLGVHLFLGAVAAGALANAGIVDNSFVAFGAGVGAVLVIKKASSYALAAVPSDLEDGTRHGGESPRGED